MVGLAVVVLLGRFQRRTSPGPTGLVAQDPGGRIRRANRYPATRRVVGIQGSWISPERWGSLGGLVGTTHTAGRRHPGEAGRPGALGAARVMVGPRASGRPGMGHSGAACHTGGGRHLTPAGDGRGGIVRTRTLFDQLIQVRGSRRCDRRPGRVHRPPADGRRSLAAGSLRSSGGKARARGRCREAGPRRRRSDARARGRWG